MATIIDSLLVTLGLDSTQFARGSAQVDGSLKKITAEAAKFMAVIGGTVAIKRFVEDTIASSAALDRLSQNLGESVDQLSALSNAAEQAGGSAAGLQGTLDMLSRAQTELQLTGQSGLIPYFTSLGVSMADARGQARPVSEMLLDLSEKFGQMPRTTANNFGRMMGIDQGTMNLLLKGRSEVEMMIKRQKEYGAVTKEQAEAASRAERVMIETRQTFVAFGRDLLQAAMPALEMLLGLFKSFGDWIAQNQEFVKAFLVGIAVGLGAIALATTPINITAAAVLALAAGIATLYDDYQTWKKGGDSLIDWSLWGPGIELAKQGIGVLKGLLHDLMYRMFAAIDAHKALISLDWEGFKRAGAEVIGGSKAGYSSPASAPAAAAGDAAASVVAQLMKKGWTKEQAIGLAANIKAESNFNAGAVGDNGQAYGIAQWHPDRQSNFRRFAGKDIRGSSLEEQVAFMHYELTQGTEQAAGAKIKGARTAREAAALGVTEYERPLDKVGEALRRGNWAEAYGRPGAAAGAMQQSPISGANTRVETHIGTVTVNTQAKDADGIARDFSKAMNYNLTAQTNYGMF